LTPTGQLDTSFTVGSGADAFINAVAIDITGGTQNGKIYIVGGFGAFNGTSRNGIARLTSAGTLDTSFNPGGGINPGGTQISAIQAVAVDNTVGGPNRGKNLHRRQFHDV